jgi:hypothetical protein
MGRPKAAAVHQRWERARIGCACWIPRGNEVASATPFPGDVMWRLVDLSTQRREYRSLVEDVSAIGSNAVVS